MLSGLISENTLASKSEQGDVSPQCAKHADRQIFLMPNDFEMLSRSFLHVLIYFWFS